MLFLVLPWSAACTDREKKAPQPAHAALAKPDARLVLMTDLHGYLEPCGCQAHPLGGIDRAATRLAELRDDGIPTAVVAAGNLLFEHGDAHKRADDKATVQERWKAETLVGILNDLQLAAAAPGPDDLQQGQQTLSALLDRARFPLLGRIAREVNGDAPATQVLRAGDLRIGLLAIVAKADETADALTARARAALPTLRQQKAQVVVALVHAPPREARRMAGQIAGVDFVVLTGRDSDEAAPPGRRGDTILLTGARHGRGLLVLDLYHRTSGPYADASQWTRDAADKAVKRQVDDLRARIAEWEKDPKVDPGQLENQKRRLAKLEGELNHPAQAQQALTDNAFSARFITLTTDMPQDPATHKLLEAYDERVNSHNKTALADWKPEPAPEGQASYVGSAQCQSCHTAAYTWWKGHPHGNAYATLQERNKEYNLSCVGCHVTGYLEPGGSTVTHVEGLTDVGCESCHGPGSLHNGDKAKIVRAPSESVCVTCHNEEHSDQFEFDTYRARLIVPGHGLPPSDAP